MSKYTTEVRFICEMNSFFSEEDLSTKSPDEIITAAAPHIFNFSFPIYDEKHRLPLEVKILKHYYTREIGAETVALWKLWLNSRLNDILPKYNKLYEAEQITFNRELNNIDVTTTSHRIDDFLRSDDFTSSENSVQEMDELQTNNLSRDSDQTRTDNLAENITGSDLQKRKFSDTPQGSVTFNGVNDENYWLSDYTETETTTSSQKLNTGTQRTIGSVDDTGTVHNESESNSSGTKNNTGTSANTGTQDLETHEVGYRGSKTYFELLSDYNLKVLNIDLMIINELSDLFMKLW